MASKFTKVKSVEEALQRQSCAPLTKRLTAGGCSRDNALALYPKDEDNDITKIHDRANRDANAYDEGLKLSTMRWLGSIGRRMTL